MFRELPCGRLSWLSFEFLERFTEAVERTVAGEIMQGRAAGERISVSEYDETITLKRIDDKTLQGTFSGMFKKPRDLTLKRK